MRLLSLPFIQIFTIFTTWCILEQTNSDPVSLNSPPATLIWDYTNYNPCLSLKNMGIFTTAFHLNTECKKRWQSILCRMSRIMSSDSTRGTRCSLLQVISTTAPPGAGHPTLEFDACGTLKLFFIEPVYEKDESFIATLDFCRCHKATNV